jgi:hypothetical protein
VLVGGGLRDAGLALLVAYGVVLTVSGIHAAARFRSLALGVLQPPAVLASQATYVVGFVRGLMESPRARGRQARAPAS